MRIAKVLIFDARGNALILRRSATHPHYAHEADVPGGIVERGESFEAGLVREIFEETGIAITPEHLTLAATREGFGLSIKQLYTAILDDRPAVTLSWEHDDYEWVAPNELLTRLQSKDDFMKIVHDYVVHEL